MPEHAAPRATKIPVDRYFTAQLGNMMWAGSVTTPVFPRRSRENRPIGVSAKAAKGELTRNHSSCILRGMASATVVQAEGLALGGWKGALVACLSLLVFSQVANSEDSVTKAATRYVPGVIWHIESLIRADFTCRGHKQMAILGESSEAVVVAVFLNGLYHRPEVLRSKFPRGSTKLEAEDLDYDPKDLGYPLPGFQRSKTCKGLSLDDGATDPAHLYWNHESGRFDFWRN